MNEIDTLVSTITNWIELREAAQLSNNWSVDRQCREELLPLLEQLEAYAQYYPSELAQVSNRLAQITKFYPHLDGVDRIQSILHQLIAQIN